MILIYNPELTPVMKKTIESLGYLFIPSMPLTKLPPGIAAHPDMQICPIDETTLLCAPECLNYYSRVLPESVTVIPGKTRLDGTYPRDSAYNAAEVGDFFFCNTKCIDKKLLHLKKEAGKKIIHVNQGYTKCNIFAFSSKGLFTEDYGIHNTIMVNRLPIESILLPKGEINLNHYGYGFIGGSCGICEKNVFWYGNPDLCSYHKTIHHILEREGIKEVSLSQENLHDLGGIICLP